MGNSFRMYHELFDNLSSNNLGDVHRQRFQHWGCAQLDLPYWNCDLLDICAKEVFPCIQGMLYSNLRERRTESLRHPLRQYAPLDRVQPVVLFHEGDPEDQLILNSEGPIDLETAYVDPVLKQVPAKPSRRRSVAQSPDTDRNDSDLDDGDKETDEEAEMMREHEPDDVIA